MGFNESDTRAKLIDPVLHSRGWTEDLIRREETAGAIEIINGRRCSCNNSKRWPSTISMMCWRNWDTG